MTTTAERPGQRIGAKESKTMSTQSNKRTSKARADSLHSVVGRTPREAVEEYAKSVGAAVGKIVEHHTFSSITINTRPAKKVELWRLPAGRRFRVYSGQRFVGEAKNPKGITTLLSSPNVALTCGGDNLKG